MRNIAIYKLPGQKRCSLLQTDELQQSVSGMAYIDKSGFVIAPFEISAQTPLIYLCSDIINEYADAEAVPDDIGDACKQNIVTNPPCVSEEDYFSDFAVMHQKIVSDDVQKIVLSRSMRMMSDESPVTLFKAACRLYPDCYVALFSTPQTGTWLVASPEMLISVDSQGGRTMALAGTRRRVADDEQWDEKNRREQQIVSDYVLDTLSEMVADVTVHAPVTVDAGSLQHLCTKFEFAPVDIATTRDLIGSMHPTPAVCGVPKSEALALISEEEHTLRLYYSGYSGPMMISGSTHLYVSLRCMLINDGACTLYAGGGLLAESDVAKEWGETENKMTTMKMVIEEAEK